MYAKHIWKILGIGVLFLALIVGVSFYTAQAPARMGEEASVAVQARNVTISIESLYTNKPVSITAGDTALGLLQRLDAEDPQLQLTSKTYSGLGTLVESMQGMTNGDQNQYWQYKVNGVMPQIAAGQYELRDGDSIEWYFGVSES